MTRNTFVISADLGQVNDYTAITIIESTGDRGTGFITFDTPKQPEPLMLCLRHIERPERGTTYPKIVERIKELCESPQLRYEDRAVVIDMTGLGKPIWDFMQGNGFKGKMNGITITGGNIVTQEQARNGASLPIYHVPKRDLVSALQVAFQNGQLKIAQGLPEADTLVKELTNFKVKISVSGHDTYEAWRESIHDDIVLSAAMGVWLAQKKTYRLYWRHSR